METYKVKSLKKEVSDAEIKNAGGSIRFVSFESAIKKHLEQYPIQDSEREVKGYRVTEQGIEILIG